MEKTYRYFQPEYVGNFKCDGAKCKAHCCKFWKIFIDKDGLHAQNCHHDGTDFYSFYILTEKGLRYWRNNGHSDPHEQDDFDHDVHKHLLGTKGYVRKVNFYLY